MKHLLHLLLISTLVILIGCDRHLGVVAPEEKPPVVERIAIEAGYTPQAEKCLWYDDRPAAYTIAFDDARSTHYTVSGPALAERKMRGTFFIHTQYITDWTGWQSLVDSGHEIGSHTWSHPKMTEVSEAQQRDDLARAIADIQSHLRGVGRVPSFAYPYGLFNDQVRRVVRQFHASARGGGGLNRPDLSDDELTAVRGVGVYPPFDMPAIAGQVEQAIDQHAWVMVYFHSVSASNDSDYTTIPVERYLEHLDYVKGRSDSLWIAPMGEVTSYLRLRRDAAVRVAQDDSSQLVLTLENLQGEYAGLTPLSVRLNLPAAWNGKQLVIRDEGGAAAAWRSLSPGSVLVQIPHAGQVRIAAVKAGR